MTDDEIIALKYQHGIEASVPPDVTRSALKQFLDCAAASYIESDTNIMAVCTTTGCSFVIYNRTSDMPCPYAEDVLCKCVIVQHRFGGLCTVRFTDNKYRFTVGVVHQDDDEIKRFAKYATAWYKKPSRITPGNPEPMARRAPETYTVVEAEIHRYVGTPCWKGDGLYYPADKVNAGVAMLIGKLNELEKAQKAEE